MRVLSDQRLILQYCLITLFYYQDRRSCTGCKICTVPTLEGYTSPPLNPNFLISVEFFGEEWCSLGLRISHSGTTHLEAVDLGLRGHANTAFTPTLKSITCLGGIV